MMKSTRVKVVADSDHGYHYAPTGSVGTVLDTPRPIDDVVRVRFDGPLTSTAGREHPDGLTQVVPLADLEEVL